MEFELWSVDEYGQGAILFRDPDYKAAVAEARRLTTSANVENALTVEEKNRNWDTYFVDVLDEQNQVVDNIVYAGNRPDQQHRVSVIKGSNVESSSLEGRRIGIYLGNLDNNDWYAANHNGELISSIDDESLHGKTFMFIKPVE